MNPVEEYEKKAIENRPQPDFKPGDIVRVYTKIKEGDKVRTQIFEGAVIKIHRGRVRTTFTVRKVSFGIGVERIFPFYSPSISKVEVVTRGKVRRAKLYYLRKLSGKAARIKKEEDQNE